MAKLAEEQAYEQIKNMIVRAELEPGSRLVHRKLATQLGMSTIPIIPALRLLEHDGLVVNIPGLGAHVRTWSRDEMADLYRMRALLDGFAARLCAARATRVDIARIEAANDLFLLSNEAEDLEAVIQTDVDFHWSVVQGAHNAYLEVLYNNLSLTALSIRMLMLRSQEPALPQDDDPVLRHFPIIEALKNGDIEGAGYAAEQHAERTLSMNLRWFEEEVIPDEVAR